MNTQPGTDSDADLFGPRLNTDLMFSSATDEWSTPQWLFDALDKEFGFTLDPCSNGGNARCARAYSVADSGLLKDWGTETVFMNPPYSQCSVWMHKAYAAAQHGATVVCLVPARTDTAWWHSYAMKGEIRLLRGRLRFGTAKAGAPFPSAIVVFRPDSFSLTTWEPDHANPRPNAPAAERRRATRLWPVLMPVLRRPGHGYPRRRWQGTGALRPLRPCRVHRRR